MHTFERVDIILYHGGRGVQYSLSDPVISGFQNTPDYASMILWSLIYN